MPDQELRALFLTHFGTPPSHVVEAPGRVNLIGDHTDYNHLPVLPVALVQRIRLVMRPRSDNTVHIVPLATGHDPTRFEVSDAIVPEGSGHWSNYVRGAAQAVAQLLEGQATGFDAILMSDVPVAAGLSSSSALVVATVMALLELNGGPTPGGLLPDLSRLEIAALAARAERYVGTEGGGMDQAASVCGEAGHALFIQFAPLRVTPIAVPDSWRFVVVHSGVTAEKSGAVEADYNRRVAECRAALARIGGDNLTTYPQLLESKGEAELEALTDAHLHGDERKRFRHTVSEARRVERAREALRDGDAPTFGALMTQSHRSLAEDYEVSTDLLDEMVVAALDAGALGARLTGAGFGGSVVALTHEGAAQSVLDAMSAPVARQGSGAPAAFVVVPSGGARVRAI